MPALTRPKQEKYSRLKARGDLSDAECARRSGYKPKNVSKTVTYLNKCPHVKMRVDEIKRELTELTDNNTIDLLDPVKRAEYLVRAAKGQIRRKKEEKGKIAGKRFSKKAEEDYDLIKALAEINKMQGTYAPQRVEVQSVSFNIDLEGEPEPPPKPPADLPEVRASCVDVTPAIDPEKLVREELMANMEHTNEANIDDPSQ